jgi:2-polyprenyl-6-methoxyphenol hydroxylase-like FAD-dependent oxidoreductase
MNRDTDVVVVGAGPTGLALAGELALQGVRCRVLERRGERPNLTRAFAVHARTLELLDARGLADAVVAGGIPVHEVAPTPKATVELGGLDTRYPMVLIAPQGITEQVLEDRAAELGVEVVRGAQVAGLRQDARGVRIERADGTVDAARYAVGCDGAHSTVRGLLGVDFVGAQYATHILLADVRLTAPPDVAMFAETSAAGAVIVVPFGDGWFRAIAWDRLREQVPLDVPLPMSEMRDAFDRICGADFGMAEQRWSTRFLSERRQARTYRVGSSFLAGDAAHVHSPLGGQGMNTGIGDALNLGWKLAAAVQGWSPPWLLDSYQTERHRVGRQVLALTDGFNRMVLGHSDLRRAAQARLVELAVALRPTREFLVGRLTGLGVGYPPRSRGAHRWVGRRTPDLPCVGGRLYELLREGRFLLVEEGSAAWATQPWASHVRPVRRVDIPGRETPAAVLVRPDGYVAWAQDRTPTAQEVAGALERWCGPGTSGTRPLPAPEPLLDEAAD